MLTIYDEIREFAGLRLTGARIDGIEATQTIQYYKSDHLTDPANRGADNAVVLAAYKPAWVRTYVRSGLGPVAGLTGKLTVERRRLGFLWDPVATLLPQPAGATITAQPTADYATERGSIANTLNFIILAADCHGFLRLTVDLIAANGNTMHTLAVTVRATLIQTLRLRGIMIAYNGPSTAIVAPGAAPPNLTLPAPTLANLQSTASRALLAMPVQSAGSFALAGSGIAFTQPLDDARSGAGQCSTNWGSLLTLLATQRTNDGNRSDVVYFGLLPTGMPLNVPGCGFNGLGAGVVGDVQTLLHEIGHGYGFQHTPCGAAGTTDANYPSYKPYPTASIGEYGLDISNGQVFPPQSSSDYMSYCFPQWMSLYQHERLVGHPRLNPSWISDNPIGDQYAHWKDYLIPDYIPDPPGDPWKVAQVRPDPVISVIGIVRSESEVEVTSVARVRAVSTPPGRAVALHARLVDEAGRELARASLFALAPQGGGCGCCNQSGSTAGEPPYIFQAMIPDVAPGAGLAIRAGDKVLWERRAPEQPPRIGAVTAELTRQGTVRLSWEAGGTTGGTTGATTGATSGQFEAWVQRSNHEGKIWHGLTTGLTGSTAEVSLAGVPAGVALLRILLHDGFHTVVSEPVSVDVPARPPEAAILSPADGWIFMAGGAMRLWAAATDSAGTPLPEDACRWLLDGQEAGHGADLYVTAPPAREHNVTLTVQAASGEVQLTARFVTIGAESGLNTGLTNSHR